MNSAISAAVREVPPSGVLNWLPQGPLADANDPTTVSFGDAPAIVPSVPEPWNYVSAIATIIPVGLLYWGLRKGARHNPRKSSKS